MLNNLAVCGLESTHEEWVKSRVLLPKSAIYIFFLVMTMSLSSCGKPAQTLSAQIHLPHCFYICCWSYFQLLVIFYYLRSAFRFQFFQPRLVFHLANSSSGNKLIFVSPLLHLSRGCCGEMDVTTIRPRSRPSWPGVTESDELTE